MSFIGRSVPRLEDGPLVTGRGRFAADMGFPHMLHMRVVRSGYAHGRITSIDSSEALALPGVVAVWTSADVADIPPIDFRLTRIEGLAHCRQRLHSIAGQTARRVDEVHEPFAPGESARIRQSLLHALQEEFTCLRWAAVSFR